VEEFYGTWYQFGCVCTPLYIRAYGTLRACVSFKCRAQCTRARRALHSLYFYSTSALFMRARMWCTIFFWLMWGVVFTARVVFLFPLCVKYRNGEQRCASKIEYCKWHWIVLRSKFDVLSFLCANVLSFLCTNVLSFLCAFSVRFFCAPDQR